MIEKCIRRDIRVHGLVGRNIKVVDCGNATADMFDNKQHYTNAKRTDAYEIHDNGVDAALDQIPDNGHFYLTIDADGLDPAIMPAVMAPTPGGLSWIQIRKLVHGLVKRGKVLGMDIVEIATSRDVGDITMIHAERLICNFIGARVRAGYYDAE